MSSKAAQQAERLADETAQGVLSPVGSAVYRAACARFATGVSVVTCLDAEGHPHGLTINSFTSISLEPPLILVSIDLSHAILGHFLKCPWFAVNVLSEDQERISHRFSSVSENRFNDVDWQTGESGMPLLAGTLAHLECSAVRHIEIGDHAVLIGEVRRASHSEGKPLIYFNRCYRSLRDNE